MSEPDPDVQAPEASLGTRATHAAAWSFIGFGAGQVVRLAGNLILTRLLFPEAFGLMALAQVLLQGLALFSDLGIGPSIIQNKSGDDRDFLDTAWTLQALRGLVLTTASILVAWPFAQFYNDERLFWVVVIIGCSAIFQGLTSSKQFTVGRHLNLKRLVAIEFSSQIIGLIAMVSWALISPTYWALVAGGLAVPLAKSLLSQTALPGPINRFRWHAPSARSLFSFGKWIFLSTALTFFAGQSDRLIFAKLIPMDMLGVYSTGAMVALMPITLFRTIEHRVIFPVYSAVVREGRELAPMFTQLRGGYMTAAGIVCAILIAAGPGLIEFMYDDRYRDAGWVLRYLTIGTWFTLVQTTYGAAHLATARVRWVAASSLSKMVGIVAFVLLGYEVAGFEGAVLGYSLSEVLRYAVLAAGGRVMKLPGFAQDLFLSAYVAFSVATGLAATSFLLGEGAGPLAESATIIAVVGSLWIPLAYKYVGQTIELARRR